jgi:hypothetical protein
MYEYIFVYIVLSFLQLLIFLSEIFFPYFFHVRLNILDQVVSKVHSKMYYVSLKKQTFRVHKN